MKLKSLLNRAAQLPEDNLYLVAPLGEFPIVWQGQPLLQVIDAAAVKAMANRIEPGEELLVDFDHFSDDPDKSSEAAGWIQGLQARDDGLYAQILWTDTGKAAILNRRFRYPSPVWRRADCEDLGNRRVRPLRLDELAITNKPNIKGIKPLSNREITPAQPAEKGVQPMDYKAKLLAMLGLKPEATDAEIDAACASSQSEMENRKSAEVLLKNRAETAEQKLVALEKTALEAQVEKDLDRFKDRIVNRDAVKQLLLANREQAVKILEGIAPIVDPNAKVLNRADGKTPAPAAEANASRLADQQKFIEEVRIKNRCSYTEAAAQASSLKPELFKS
jgi:phage I-like protein